MVHVTRVNDGSYEDEGFIPWVLLITTWAVWAVATILRMIFGGWRRHHDATAAAAPGAGVNGGYPAAPVRGVSTWSKRANYITDGLRTLLWLMLIPVLVNQMFGFNDHTARDLIIAVFVIGMVWAFLRGLGHFFHFLHRIVDFLLIPLVALAIAAAALGIREHHPDIFHDD